jgi:uncharacterized protein YdhG (YjbR/CyaY superfamily)
MIVLRLFDEEEEGELMADETLTVAAYIAERPQNVQEILRKLSALARTAAPDCEEVIRWGMPTYQVRGKSFFIFGAQKNHIGIYGGVPEAFAKRLANFKTSKGCVQFQYKETVPYELIAEIIAHKLKEIGQTGKGGKGAQ